MHTKVDVMEGKQGGRLWAPPFSKVPWDPPFRVLRFVFALFC